jgi:anaerobic ribonucleoside-triphosphate reductase
MGKTKVSQIRKRDGSVVAFEPSKIEQAIYRALMATRTGDKELAAGLAQQVMAIVEDRFVQSIPSV